MLAFACQNAQYYAELGIKDLEEGRASITAWRHFEEALNKDPDNSLANYGMGTIQIREKYTFDRAYKMLEKSITGLKDKKRKENAYSLVSKAYLALQKPKKAVEILNKAFAEGVESPKLCNNQAIFYINLGKNNKAEEVMLKCVDKFPADASSYYNLGYMLAHQFRDYKGALKYLLKSNELRPHQIDTIKALMKVSYKLKKKKDALKFAEILQKKYQEKAKRQEIQQTIKEIKSQRWKVKFEQ